MAWCTKSGQASDRESEAATPRGIEPRAGVHVPKSAEEQLRECQEMRDRWARIRSGQIEYND